VQAELAGALGVPGGQVGGQLAAVGLSLFLEGDELVGETAGARLNVPGPRLTGRTSGGPLGAQLY
jgi:hypothetical protein